MLNLKQDDKKATIDIIGVIGGGLFEDGLTAEKFAADLAEVPMSMPIVANISSPGGSVAEGLVMYDLLAARPDVTTNTFGLTGSMATVIGQAATKGKRKMSKNGMYLIHRLTTIEMGTPTDLRNEADNAEAVENRLVQIYAQKTGRREATIRRLMAANKERGDWWDAETALDLGFIDEITPDDKRSAYSRSELRHMNIAVTPEMIEKELVKQENMDIVEQIKTGFNDLKNFVSELIKKPDTTDSQKNEWTEKLTALGTQIAELTQVNADKTTEIETLKTAHAAALAAKDEEITKLKAAPTKEDKAEDEGPDGKKKVPDAFDRMVDAIKNKVKYS